MISLSFSRPHQTFLCSWKAQTFILPPFFIHRNLQTPPQCLSSFLHSIHQFQRDEVYSRCSSLHLLSHLRSRLRVSHSHESFCIISITIREVFSPSSINCRSRNIATGMDDVVRCDTAVEEYDVSDSSSSLPSIHPFKELTRYPTCVFIQTKTQKYQSCIQLNKVILSRLRERTEILFLSDSPNRLQREMHSSFENDREVRRNLLLLHIWYVQWRTQSTLMRETSPPPSPPLSSSLSSRHRSPQRPLRPVGTITGCCKHYLQITHHSRSPSFIFRHDITHSTWETIVLE